MKKSSVIFKLALLSVAASQLIIGVIACIPGTSLSKLAEMFYRASLETTPQLEHVAHMFGAYMLVIGVLAVFALCNPAKNIAITHGISILLILRVIQRVIFAKQALQYFEIPVVWYWAQTIFFLAVACILFLLSPKEKNSE
jgi:hypothetical protein